MYEAFVSHHAMEADVGEKRRNMKKDKRKRTAKPMVVVNRFQVRGANSLEDCTYGIRGSHNTIDARNCFKVLRHKAERREAKMIINKELSEIQAWKQVENEKCLLSERSEMLEDILFRYIDTEYYDVVKNVIARFDHMSDNFNISDVFIAVDLAIKNAREEEARAFEEEMDAFNDFDDGFNDDDYHW